MRSIPILGVVLVLALASSAGAKPKKETPVRSAPGGANLKSACNSLADAACTLAKRCDPDKSKRRCRIVHERCATAKDAVAKHATDDDVNFCVQAMEEVSCKSAKFDNEQGVNIDLKKIDICGQVATDNLFPNRAGEGSTPAEAEKTDKSDKADKTDKAEKSKGSQDPGDDGEQP